MEEKHERAPTMSSFGLLSPFGLRPNSFATPLKYPGSVAPLFPLASAVVSRAIEAHSHATPIITDSTPSSSSTSTFSTSSTSTTTSSPARSPSPSPSRSSTASATWRRLLESDEFPLKMSDFECTICYNLLCEPITISCGHSFCRTCLVSCLDRSKKSCPNCRSPCHIAAETQPASIILTDIIQKLFPQQYAQRVQETNNERERWSQKIPLFLTTSPMFPGQPLSMHLFEARYRLMLTRIMNSTKRFGVIASDKEKLQRNDVGTIFEVLQCEILADGRALVQCVGRSRFKLLEYWVEDGTQNLHYGSIEDLQDVDEEKQDSSATNFISSFSQPAASSSVYSGDSMEEDDNTPMDPVPSFMPSPMRQKLYWLSMKGRECLSNIMPYMPHLRSQLEKQFGDIPGSQDGSTFPDVRHASFVPECTKLSFWFSSILPVPPNVKLELLSCNSTLRRMEAAVNFLTALLEDLRKRPLPDAQQQQQQHAAAMHQAILTGTPSTAPLYPTQPIATAIATPTQAPLHPQLPFNHAAAPHPQLAM